MSHLSRFVLPALVACSLASSARAVDVTLELRDATTTICTPDLYGEGGRCFLGTPPTVAPATPRGLGVLHFDASGDLIRGSLSVEAFSVEGLAVPAWSGDVEVGLPTPATGWPVPGGHVEETPYISFSSFTSQADFSGTLHLTYPALYDPISGEATSIHLGLTFTSVPGGVVECPGERLFLDEDGDGKVDRRDAASWQDDLFGDAIDSEGRTPSQFCSIVGNWFAAFGNRKRSCQRLDYRNDEPMRRRPGDCKLLPINQHSDWSCSPTELVFRSAPPGVPTRSCLGFPVVDDADADGEPDPTDRCSGTPSGSAIDGDGCSVEQFCSQQSVQSCRRADFGNDEPLVKRPGDCARTQSKPRACTAATSN